MQLKMGTNMRSEKVERIKKSTVEKRRISCHEKQQSSTNCKSSPIMKQIVKEIWAQRISYTQDGSPEPMDKVPWECLKVPQKYHLPGSLCNVSYKDEIPFIGLLPQFAWIGADWTYFKSGVKEIDTFQTVSNALVTQNKLRTQNTCIAKTCFTS